MIQIIQGGFALSYQDDSGQTVTVSLFDQANYKKAIGIRNDQIQNEAVNANAKSAYYGALQNFQANIDVGRVGPNDKPPAKPMMHVVTDTGKEYDTDFVPALEGPHYPTITPGAALQTIGGSASGGASVPLSLFAGKAVFVDPVMLPDGTTWARIK